MCSVHVCAGSSRTTVAPINHMSPATAAVFARIRRYLPVVVRIAYGILSAASADAPIAVECAQLDSILTATTIARKSVAFQPSSFLTVIYAAQIAPPTADHCMSTAHVSRFGGRCFRLRWRFSAIFLTVCYEQLSVWRHAKKGKCGAATLCFERPAIIMRARTVPSLCSGIGNARNSLP